MGARMVLRQPDIEIAFLEVARGGLLRRGLAVHSARAALVTNVAEDHVGEYGIRSVDDLVEAKLSIYRGLARNGVLVVNADDSISVTHSAHIPVRISWYSLDTTNNKIVSARKGGDLCAWFEKDRLWFSCNGTEEPIVSAHPHPALGEGLPRD